MDLSQFSSFFIFISSPFHHRIASGLSLLRFTTSFVVSCSVVVRSPIAAFSWTAFMIIGLSGDLASLGSSFLLYSSQSVSLKLYEGGVLTFSCSEFYL